MEKEAVSQNQIWGSSSAVWLNLIPGENHGFKIHWSITMVFFEVTLPLESYVNTTLSEKMVVVVFILKYNNIAIWYHYCKFPWCNHSAFLKREYNLILFTIMKVIRLKLCIHKVCEAVIEVIVFSVHRSWCFYDPWVSSQHRWPIMWKIMRSIMW